MAALKVDAILRSGIRKFTDEARTWAGFLPLAIAFTPRFRLALGCAHVCHVLHMWWQQFLVFAL